MTTEFFQTRMGMKFYEGTVPRLAKHLSRIADALEEQNKLMKEQNKLMKEKKDE